jgi:hypothetical protein
MLDPQASTYKPETAARIWPVVERLFARVADGVVADLRRRFPDASIIVTSDHGNEGVGRLVLPNVALRQAGLLHTTARGTIDLARTQVVFNHNKAFTLYVNSTDWKGGIVAPAEREALLRKTEAVLLGIRDPETGEAAIRAVFDPDRDGIALGIGGDGAGDLMIDPAFDFYTSQSAAGDSPVRRTPPTGLGVHGPAPWRRKLHAILYMHGPNVPAVQLGIARSIDVAPTAAALLGIDPPRDAVGRALVPR